MSKLIIFLIRCKLGLKKSSGNFKFTNQKSSDIYYFTKTSLRKKVTNFGIDVPSDVGLNWLLNPKCKIKAVIS